MFSEYLDVNPVVKEAIEQGKPVVALESTIISHGMPYPDNVKTAVAVEEAIKPVLFKNSLRFNNRNYTGKN